MTVGLARTERLGLVAALRRAGPDAPTLCAGWTTRDLAVHLLLRERRPDATAGSFLPPLSGWTDRVARGYRARDFAALVDDIEDGPPWFSPFALTDRYLNLAEMFVHHEDVLRGGADAAGPWLPRKLSPELQAALQWPLRTVGRFTMARSPVRVSLGSDDGRTLLTVGRGEPVAVTGTVGELVLFAFGRAPVDVRLTGAPDAVARLLHTRRSL